MKTPEYVDTHCHIHDSEFSEKFQGKSADAMIAEAEETGTKTLVCVGTDLASSTQAIEFCRSRAGCYASVALHPHESAAKSENELRAEMESIDQLLKKTTSKLVAIGECGLDFYYHDDPRTLEKQKSLLIRHIELAQKYRLPMIFHIRKAFEEFFTIIDEYEEISGVVHSFSATQSELDGVLARGLYVGLNGIMTFTKDQRQLDAAKSAPLDRIVLETDAPFLTPAPYRGKMCEPKHVVVTAQFLSELRGENHEEFVKQTTQNARRLFSI